MIKQKSVLLQYSKVIFNGDDRDRIVANNFICVFYTAKIYNEKKYYAIANDMFKMCAKMKNIKETDFQLINKLIEEFEDKDAMYILGLIYYYGNYFEQDYKKAFEIFVELGEKYNYVWAKIMLGWIYFNGEYIKQNYKKAYQLFFDVSNEISDKYSYNYSNYMLGKMYYNGNGIKKNKKKAELYWSYLIQYDNQVKAYPKSVKVFISIFNHKFTENNEYIYDGLYELGKMYYNGDGIEKNIKKSFNILKRIIFEDDKYKEKSINILKSAREHEEYKNILEEISVTETNYILEDEKLDEMGRIYKINELYGKGIINKEQKDKQIEYIITEKVKKIVDELDNKQKSKSKYKLGEKYFRENDYEKAYFLLDYVAKIDNEENYKESELIDARYIIGIMYYNGYFLKQSYKSAFNFFNFLIEKYNHKKSKKYVAKMYLYGRGVERNHRKAYELYKELVEEDNDIEAEFQIGTMYLYGNNYVDKNLEKAFNTFNKLINQYDYSEDKNNEIYLRKSYNIIKELIEKYDFQPIIDLELIKKKLNNNV